MSVLSIGLFACDSHNNSRKSSELPASVYDGLLTQSELSTFASLLDEAELKAELTDAGAVYTLFAPTDEALAELPMEIRHAIMRDPDMAVLKYHFIRDNSIDAVGAVVLLGERIATGEGGELVLSMADNQLFVNDATVVGAPIETRNGVVYPINRLLTPPVQLEPATRNTLETLRSDQRFSKFVEMLETTGVAPLLEDTSKSFTVFAPTENAFPYLEGEVFVFLRQILSDEEFDEYILTNYRRNMQNHILEGVSMDSLTLYSLNAQSIRAVSNSSATVEIDEQGLMIGYSPIIEKNIYTTNGVIHVVDRRIEFDWTDSEIE